MKNCEHNYIYEHRDGIKNGLQCSKCLDVKEMSEEEINKELGLDESED